MGNCLLIVLMVVSIVGAGCLDANEDERLPEPEVFRIGERIDVDGDGQGDFYFMEVGPTRTLAGRGASNESSLELYGDVQYLDDGLRQGEALDHIDADRRGYSLSLKNGDVIGGDDSNTKWKWSITLARGDLFENTWRGDFIGNDPQYIGVRLQRPSGYYYGWIWLNIDTTGAGRFPMNADSTYFAARRPMFSVYGYSVQKEAGVPIVAGERP